MAKDFSTRAQVSSPAPDVSPGLPAYLQMDEVQKRKIGRFLTAVETQYKVDETGNAVKLAPEEGVVHIQRAEGLKMADMYDGSDPYCVVFWNEQEVGRSRVFEDSNSPEFDQMFEIRVPQGDTAADDRVNTLRVEVFDYDDSALDDEPDFMGQVIITGEGSEALPREETTYPLTRKLEYDYMINTATHSYMNPYNDAVGGTLTLKYLLASDLHPNERIKAVVTKSLRESRAPHVSAPPIDLSYCDIDTCADIPDRARETGTRVWSAAEMKTLKLKCAPRAHRFDQSASVRMKSPATVRAMSVASGERSFFDASMTMMESAAAAVAEPEPEPEPEPEQGQSQLEGEGGESGAVSKQSSSNGLSWAVRQKQIHPKLKPVIQDAFVRIFEAVASEKSTLTKFFHQMDADGNGSLDGEEFAAALATLGLQLTRAEERLCIKVLDKDGDGSVDLEEFVERMNAVRRAQLQGGTGSKWTPDATPEDPIEVRDGVRLGNNRLSCIADLPAAIAPYLLMQRPTTLQWLDLSFNQLSVLDAGAIDAMPNLSILYLHANRFESFKAVGPIATLSRLEKLTLHGNTALEQLPGYRHRALVMGALLRELDFVAVSAADKTKVKQLRETRQLKAKRASRKEGAVVVARNPYGRVGRSNSTMLGRNNNR